MRRHAIVSAIFRAVMIHLKEKPRTGTDHPGSRTPSWTDRDRRRACRRSSHGKPSRGSRPSRHPSGMSQPSEHLLSPTRCASFACQPLRMHVRHRSAGAACSFGSLVSKADGRAAHAAHGLHHVILGADIRRSAPARAAGGSAACQCDLLLVASRERAERRLRIGRADARP